MCISLPHTDTEQSPPKDAPAGMDPTLWLSLSQRLALDASGAVIRLKDKDGMRENVRFNVFSVSFALSPAHYFAAQPREDGLEVGHSSVSRWLGPERGSPGAST